VKPIATLGVQLARIGLDQDLRESAHRAQGGPEIVGHRIAEGFQLAVRGLNGVLGGGQSLLGPPALGDVADNLRSPDEMPSCIMHR
jgi:hypothetical protein